MATTFNKAARKGFTLIELLIVIGILGILAAIILVAVDPQKRLRQARNARRASEVNAILNAVLNYTVDNRGTLPRYIANATTTNVYYSIGNDPGTPPTAGACPNTITGGTVGTTATNTANLGTDLVDAYIAEMPVDPRGVNDNGDVFNAVQTGYYIKRTTNGRIEVGSCNPENEGSGVVAIKVKR